MTTTLKQMMAAGTAAAPAIAPAEAMAMIEAGTAIAVDLREDSEVAVSGKIKGAICAPRSRLEGIIDPASPGFAAALDPRKLILLYCRSGGRATLASTTFNAMGYLHLRNLGGFDDWVSAGGSIEK